MNAELILTGATISYVDIRRTEKSPKWTIVHMRTNYCAQACAEMGWQPSFEGITNADLAGLLAASHMILTPTDKKLKHHEIQVDLTDVADFGYYSVAEGESTKLELRFKMRTSKPGAAALFDDYWEKIGFAPATLKIAYAKQETLPGMEKKAEAAKA